MNNKSIVFVVLSIIVSQICATSVATQYIYDDEGRISAIVNSQGEKRFVDQSMFNSDRTQTVQPDSGVQVQRDKHSGASSDVNEQMLRDKAKQRADKNGIRAVSETITQMRPNVYNDSYSPYLPIHILGGGYSYTLSNGGSFNSGSTNSTRRQILISSVEVVGDQVFYTFIPFGTEPFLDFYDFGNNSTNSAEGILGLSGAVTLQATIGSTTGIMTGGLEILDNQQETVPESTFTRFDSIEGSVVPFNVDVTLSNGATWAVDTFDTSISYSTSAFEISFDNPISAPVLESISVGGTAQIPPDTEVGFNATLSYVGGYEVAASDLVQWSVAPEGIVTIDSFGTIVSGAAMPDDVALTITAQFQGFSAETTTLLISSATLESADANDWSTYQGGPNHTGYVPLQIEENDFSIRWETSLSGLNSFQQVVTSGDKVFAVARSGTDIPQLYAIDAKNGQTLWSSFFGNVNYIDPPATAFGNVYVRTGYTNNSNSDVFYALNGDSGAEIFSKSYDRSFDDFEAPVISDGSVFLYTNANSNVNGGRLQRFDAFTGEDIWEATLRTDEFHSPTVIGSSVFTHVDQYLQSTNIDTGELTYTLQDPSYDNSSIYGRALVKTSENSGIAVVGDNLIKYNLQSPPGVEWSVIDDFRTDVTVGENVAYIATFSEFRAYDLDTGSLLWMWTDGSGSISGSIAATKTHVFVRRSNGTLVFDIGTKTLVTTIPRNGNLSIANENLYITSGSGRLTAVELPSVIEAPVESIEIMGAGQVAEFSSTDYQLNVTYADGSVRNRTALAVWNLKNSNVASVTGAGRLVVGQLSSPAMAIDLGVQYSENGVTSFDSKNIDLFSNLTNTEFSLRGLDDALMIELSILNQLEDVRRNLEAARNGVVDEMSGDAQTALQEIDLAIDKRQQSFDELQLSRDAVESAISILTGSTPIRTPK